MFYPRTGPPEQFSQNPNHSQKRISVARPRDRAVFRRFNQYACNALHQNDLHRSKNNAKARHVRGHGLHNMLSI